MALRKEQPMVVPPNVFFYIQYAHTVDFIGNKVLGQSLSGFFLWSTRRLCKLQAMTMTKSEKPSFVLRSTSFTDRERLMPAIACSTLTRTLDIFRLFVFSFSVNSFLRGFFSAEPFYRPWARNPENLCP
jgi:hypothetical protein